MVSIVLCMCIFVIAATCGPFCYAEALLLWGYGPFLLVLRPYAAWPQMYNLGENNRTERRACSIQLPQQSADAELLQSYPCLCCCGMLPDVWHGPRADRFMARSSFPSAHSMRGHGSLNLYTRDNDRGDIECITSIYSAE